MVGGLLEKALSPQPQIFDENLYTNNKVGYSEWLKALIFRLISNRLEKIKLETLIQFLFYLAFAANNKVGNCHISISTCLC
jgi:hypothetical protein